MDYHDLIGDGWIQTNLRLFCVFFYSYHLYYFSLIHFGENVRYETEEEDDWGEGGGRVLVLIKMIPYQVYAVPFLHQWGWVEEVDLVGVVVGGVGFEKAVEMVCECCERWDEGCDMMEVAHIKRNDERCHYFSLVPLIVAFLYFFW